LHDRSGDIPALAAFFLGLLGGGCRLTTPALAALQGYRWPGNVRELRAVLECAAALSHGGAVFPSHLPAHVAAAVGNPLAPPATGELTAAIERWLAAQLAAHHDTPATYDVLLDQIERVMLGHLLHRHDHKPARLAAAMGLHRSTLRHKLRRLGLQDEFCNPDGPA
jgi:two-component system nitrogen regulation response regulator GlnG